ncbi:hypothetical protein [Parendozoicomonas sp. Alg238-R29]|uniref:hypothetical protein n=1 Tax=Parendozoicomonas sp. Alg238-R29 TaxID=2993446 RepID=UPI00248E99D5|nr:hypothetical protein [Parendozoicomonas sp. Alg238-R29]
MENALATISPQAVTSPASSAQSHDIADDQILSTPKRPEMVGRLGPKRLTICSGSQNLLPRFDQTTDEDNHRKMDEHLAEITRWQLHENTFNDRIATKRPPLKSILGKQNLQLARLRKSRLNWEHSIPLTEAQRGKGLGDRRFTKRLRDQCRLIASEHILSRGQENRKIPGNSSRAHTMKHKIHAPFRDRYMTRAINHSIPVMSGSHTVADMVKILCQHTERDTSPERYIGHRDTTTTCFDNLLSKLPDRREDSPVQQISDSQSE